MSFHRALASVVIILATPSATGAQAIPEPVGVCVDTTFGCDDVPPPPAPPSGPRPQPGPKPRPVDQAARQLAALNAHFEEALDLAERNRIVRTADYRKGPRPRSRAEFEARFRPFYTALYAQHALISDEIKAIKEGIAADRGEVARLRSLTKSHDWDLRRVRAERDHLGNFDFASAEQRVFAGEQQVARLVGAANRSLSRSEQLRSESLTLLAALRPLAERSAIDAMGSGPISPYAQQPLATWGRSAPSPDHRPAETALPWRPLQARQVRLAPPAGVAIEESLPRSVAMAAAFPGLRTERDDLSGQRARLAGELGPLREAQARFDMELSRLRSEIAEIQPRYRQLGEREGALAYNRHIARENLGHAALTELVWHQIRDEVVLPALGSVLGETAVPPPALLAELASELREQPLKFASHFAKASATRRFLEAEQQVLELAPKFTERAEAAVAALADPHWGPGAALRDRFFAEAAEDGAALVDTATDTGDSLPARLRRFLFARPAQ
jgi:hypothetical protein